MAGAAEDQDRPPGEVCACHLPALLLSAGQGCALPIFGLLRVRLRAPRGVAVVAHRGAMGGSSSALRCIPQAAARDGQDQHDTA
jgi:hypothetical protein